MRAMQFMAEEPNTVHGCKHVIIPVGDQCTATILHISMYRRCSCNFIGSREHCTVQIQTIFVSISVMSVTTSKIQMNDWTIHCLCNQKSLVSTNIKLLKLVDTGSHAAFSNPWMQESAKTLTNVIIF